MESGTERLVRIVRIPRELTCLFSEKENHHESVEQSLSQTPFPGHNSPLFSRPEEKGQELFLNVDYTVKYLVKKGAIPEKTVLGVPLYGRAFMLKNPHDNR